MASQYVTLDGGNTWMSPEQAAAKKGAAANLPSTTSPQPQAAPSISSVQPSTQPQSPSLSSPTPAPQQSLSVPSNPGAINLNQTQGATEPNLKMMSSAVTPTAATSNASPQAPSVNDFPKLNLPTVEELLANPTAYGAYFNTVGPDGYSIVSRLKESNRMYGPDEARRNYAYAQSDIQRAINRSREEIYNAMNSGAATDPNSANARSAKAYLDNANNIISQLSPSIVSGSLPTYEQMIGRPAVDPLGTGQSVDAKGNILAPSTLGVQSTPAPLLNLQGSVTNPGAQAPQAPIPFKAGMSPAQQSSIQNLVSNKDSSQWNATDKANWSYATNNAPIPASRMSGSTYGTGSAAGASGASGSVSTGSSGATGAMGSSANTGTSSGTSNYTSQYQSLLDKVLGELQKQPQQSDYEKQLAQLAQEQSQSNADAMQGIVDVRNQPIAQQFLTGQAAAIQRQADANAARLAGKAAPLQTLLGQEQARQKDYLSNLYQAAGLAQNEEQARQQAAQQQAQLDQQLAQQKAASGKPIEVSPGATIYDPVTGKALYTAPTAKSISGTSGSSSSGSSKVGGTSGGTGSAALSSTAKAVLAGTLRLEDLTPTERGKIAGELTSANYQSTPKLSAGQQEDIATMDTVSKLIDSVISYAADGLQGVGGLYQGSVGQFLSNNFGMGSPEELNVRQLIGNIRGTIAKLRGGTSFTASEQRLLDTYVPSIDESEKSVLSKLNGLKSFIAAKRSSVESTAKDRGVKESAPASNEYQNYLNSIK